MTRRGLALAFILAAVGCSFVGCTRGHGAGASSAPADAGTKIAPEIAHDAQTTASAPASIFSVAVSGVELEITRVAKGPLLAVEPMNANGLWLLPQDGNIAPLDPVIAKIAEEYHPYWRISTLAGEWPHDVYMETGQYGARVASLVVNQIYDAESGVLKERRGESRHVVAASRWSGGRMLGFYGNDSTLDYKFGGRGAGGEFTVLSGARPAVMPKVPPTTMTDGRFIAYESGRIFLIGDDKPKATKDAPFPDSFVEMTHLYEYTEGAALPKRVEMPDFIRQLVQGRNERESLVLGGNESKTFFMRFDGAKWVDVPVPVKGHIWQVAAGDDGTVWFAPSSEEKTTDSISYVYRATFPDLQWEKVALPPGIAPTGIWATNANDVWISGIRVGIPRAPDAKNDQRSLEIEHEQRLVLLHNQKPRQPFVFPPIDERNRQVLSRKDPASYSKYCHLPFLILGTDSQVSAGDVETFRKSMPDWPFGNGILGRIRSGKVYGFDLSEADSRDTKPMYKNVEAIAKTAKAKLPNASLVCTQPIIEQAL